MENTGIKYYSIEELGTWLIHPSDTLVVNEGEQRLTQHLTRERNSKIVKLAKEHFKRRHNGRLFCEICGFDFSMFYGEIGSDFIEAHHKKPIASMQPGDETRIDDFVMVCSNCHSMLHIVDDCISPAELKIRLQAQQSNDTQA